MKKLYALALLALISTSTHAEKKYDGPSEGQQDEKRQAEYMAGKYDAYKEIDPVNEHKKVRVIYFHAADREPCAEYQKRIQRIMYDFRDYFEKEMARNGLGRRTLNLETENGKLKIHVVKGKENDGAYDYHSGGKINQELKPELMRRGIDMDQEKVIIFNGLSKVTDGTNVQLYAPYYGMGANQKYGICHVADCELLDTINLSNTTTTIMIAEHGGPRPMTLGKFNTIYIGGAIHELGHGLTLPHNKAKDSETNALGTALMGAGNYTYKQELRGEGKGSFITAAHAMRLLSQPVFSSTFKENGVDPECSLSGLVIRYEDGAIVISATVAANIEAYAAIVYNDPEGGSDYDAKAWTSYVNNSNKFLVKVGEMKPGTYSMRLTICHMNGAISTFPMQYTIDSNGVPDIASLNLPWALDSALRAYGAGDTKGLKKAVKEGLKKYKGQSGIEELLRHLLTLSDPVKISPSPEKAPESARQLSLSDCNWESAEVGWRVPKRNEYCRESQDDRRVFLELGSTFHPRGLYAHSPSLYVFKLGKHWKSFETSYGLQAGGDGAVVFVIIGDGKELFRSGPVTTSIEQKANVDVSDVDTLELVVENGGESNARCWSIWGSPVLKR